MNNKEIRSINSEFRIAPESRRIEGYALKFNSESQDLGGFKEIISRNALNGVLEQSDVLALFNHDENKILARNTYGKGTLSLVIDNIGLRYSFNAPNTPLGDEIYDMIKRGDVRNSSFAFTVSDSGQKWEKMDGTYLRTITQFDRLFDTSMVSRPAYQDTTVAVRSLDLIKTENETDKKQYIDDMNERQEICVEVKVEISDEVMEDMPINPTEELIPIEPVDTIEIDPEMEPEMDPTMEQPIEPVDPTQEPDTELIDVVIDGETYSIPKDILEQYINNRKLERYFEKIEKSINELKK